MKEECSLCGGTFSYYSLIRCPRCGKMYCRNCVIFSWDRNVLRHVPMCLNCARRMVSPRMRRVKTKYSPLSRYLAWRQRHIIYSTLTFDEIEKIIENKLPTSALQHRHWWTNTGSQVQVKAWLKAGWNVHEVNLNDRSVIFRRVRIPEKPDRKRKKSARALADKNFRPPKPRTFRRRQPSKTRVAMAIARLKNVERRRLSMKRYRGKFKPRSAFEKRLYRPEEKPEKQD